MLKSLFTKLAKYIFLPKHNPGYQTRAYPTLGEMVIIHDTLDSGSTATASQMKRINDIWLNDEQTEIFTPCDEWRSEDVELYSTPTINPANGLPMIDGVIDVAGNPYGLNDCCDVFNAGFI